MTKLKFLLCLAALLTTLWLNAQEYRLRYRGEADSSVIKTLQQNFFSRSEASTYLATLPSLLQASGYIAVSIDSLRLDSTKGEVWLFTGERYRWSKVNFDSIPSHLLQSLRINKNELQGSVEPAALRTFQQRILDELENTGYPFGRVYLDSLEINEGAVSGTMLVEPGPFYKVDSIRVYGNARVQNFFLQKYLDMPPGEPYNRTKLLGISKRISELAFLEEERPSDISMLGTGSVLNLYLRPRRSSQVNALIGFLPSSRVGNESRFVLTVDANVLLRNSFGSGETIGVVWQQLQPGSPRINLLFDQPYFLRSKFGINFSLDMYKRDSSFLNLNMSLGSSYRINAQQTGNVFLQRRQSIVSDINLSRVQQFKRLPDEADVTSFNLGLGYTLNTTDYRFNPRKGTELTVTGTAGTKNIRKNSQIVELTDPANPSFKFESLYDTVKLSAYQFRIQAALSHYIPVGKQSALRTAINGGIYQSANFFRNELFQIGGYRLLRGFDEESQFVSRYAIGTIEYRYLLQRNSAFFVFADGGYGRHIRETPGEHSYIGTGLGLSFETKAGVINLAWAVGKRDDTEFNLRASKLHLGFASYF